MTHYKRFIAVGCQFIAPLFPVIYVVLSTILLKSCKSKLSDIMAVQPKKTNNTSSSKKTPRKKKRRSKKPKHSNFKKSILIVLGVFVMISMVAFGYFLGKQDRISPTTSVAKVKKSEKKKHLQKPSKHESKKPEHSVSDIENNLSEKKPAVTIKKEEKPVAKHNQKVYLKPLSGKAKLIIIIDDVSNRRQLKSIQALHMKITPSIFPPSERSMKSHLLAKGLKHYMIHLPMESGSKQFNTQYKTLKTSFSNERIIARAKELRALFPTARYVNNHTGSVFTNDYKKMLTLYTALKKEGFMFLDSRTIATTKVPKIVQRFGDAYVYRNIFIDNVHNVKTIHKQLRKAVAIAKKKGYAIAIGHPHTTTMKALSQAKDILEEVELIYMDNLMTI